jgi:NADH-quinone oxidoreductase subunit I
MIPVNPIININRERCTTPFDCKRCLRVCPPAVFVVFATKMIKGVELDKKEPGNYAVSAMYRDKCTACMKCVDVCPVNAITMSMPEEVSP